MRDHSPRTTAARSRVAAAASAGLSILLVAGCSSAAPSESGRATPERPAATSPAVSAPAAITGGRTLGDAVAVSTVTDTLGTYEHVGISPRAKALTFDSSLLDPAAAKGLYSTAELASAQRFVAGFVASETFDGPALDDADAYPAWSARAREDLVEAGQSALLGRGTDGTNAITWNAAGTSIVPRLIRDGGPRLSRETIDVTRVYPFTGGGPGPAIAFFISAEADYRVSDAAARAYVEARDPTDTAAVREQKTLPALYDGTGENTFPVKGTLVYSVVQNGSSWRIAGVKVAYDAPQTWSK